MQLRSFNCAEQFGQTCTTSAGDISRSRPAARIVSMFGLVGGESLIVLNGKTCSRQQILRCGGKNNSSGALSDQRFEIEQPLIPQTRYAQRSLRYKVSSKNRKWRFRERTPRPIYTSKQSSYVHTWDAKGVCDEKVTGIARDPVARLDGLG